MTPKGLGYVIKKYTEKAQIRNVSPYDRCHRFGYRKVAVISLYRLSQLRGHDSLDTMMIYVQATKKDLQPDIEKNAWE